jgi:hypothetical protein
VASSSTLLLLFMSLQFTPNNMRGNTRGASRCSAGDDALSLVKSVSGAIHTHIVRKGEEWLTNDHTRPNRDHQKPNLEDGNLLLVPVFKAPNRSKAHASLCAPDYDVPPRTAWSGRHSLQPSAIIKEATQTYSFRCI